MLPQQLIVLIEQRAYAFDELVVVQHVVTEGLVPFLEEVKRPDVVAPEHMVHQDTQRFIVPQQIS